MKVKTEIEVDTEESVRRIFQDKILAVTSSDTYIDVVLKDGCECVRSELVSITAVAVKYGLKLTIYAIEYGVIGIYMEAKE